MHGDIVIETPDASERMSGAICFSVKTTEQVPDAEETTFDCINFGYYTDIRDIRSNTEYGRQFTIADSYQTIGPAINKFKLDSSYHDLLDLSGSTQEMNWTLKPERS